MTDIPIIMSAPMVLALLAARKTMTRRLAWRDGETAGESSIYYGGRWIKPSPWQHVEPGDRLWVRETHWRWGRWKGYKDGGNPRYSFDVLSSEIIFSADQATEDNPLERGKFAQVTPAWHQRPPIFLERKLSRLTLVVEAVKIERLQDITMEDMIAEGLLFQGIGKAEHTMAAAIRVCNELTPKWRALWTSLHGEASWDANPEVVALSFKVHQQNIDAMKVGA